MWFLDIELFGWLVDNFVEGLFDVLGIFFEFFLVLEGCGIKGFGNVFICVGFLFSIIGIFFDFWGWIVLFILLGLDISVCFLCVGRSLYVVFDFCFFKDILIF